MTVRFTPQGCKVVKTFSIMENGGVHEKIELSVDPASQLSLVIEESASRMPATPVELQGGIPKGSTRVRSTKFGFELVPAG